MDRSLTSWRTPSLRRRFATWFGLLFVFGAVLIRLSYYQTTVAALSRDLDELLWSRLGGLEALEQFEPEASLRDELHGYGWLLPDPIVLDGVSETSSWLGRPTVDPGVLLWFAGIWRRDGSLVDGVKLPDGFAWDAEWHERCGMIWTTADGRYRLAVTAGNRDTILLVGAVRKGFTDATQRIAIFEVATFVLWVPLVLGVAWLMFSRVLVPLTAVTAMAHRIRTGHFDERIDASRTDSEFREMAGTINDMLDRLEAIRMSQSRFNADVAHQLMNPVHAILLETEVAAEPGREGPDREAALERVGDLAQRIEQICEVLLAYSRTAALDPARLRPVDLDPIVDAAMERVERRAADLGVTIEPPPTTTVVKGDPALLEEVFVNLLANAIDHSPAGSVVSIMTARDDAGSCVSVVDHGPGVTEADLPRLFERFHSGKPVGGHGVGLALSRLIMRSHGGDVGYTPTPGGGATFTLQFPPAA
jgi:signal transduction histidine kinase